MDQTIDTLLKQIKSPEEISIAKMAKLLGEIVNALRGKYKKISDQNSKNKAQDIEFLKTKCDEVEKIVIEYFKNRLGISDTCIEKNPNNLEIELSRIAKNKKRLKIIGILSIIMFIVFQLSFSSALFMNFIGSVAVYFSLSVITTKPKYISNPDSVKDIFLNLLNDEHNNINYFQSINLEKLKSLIEAYKAFLAIKKQIREGEIEPQTPPTTQRSKKEIAPSPQPGYSRTPGPGLYK